MSSGEHLERAPRRHQTAQHTEGSTGLRIHDSEQVWHTAVAGELAIRMEMERRIAIFLNRPRPHSAPFGWNRQSAGFEGPLIRI
jgi:hypothetical protein